MKKSHFVSFDIANYCKFCRKCYIKLKKIIKYVGIINLGLHFVELEYLKKKVIIQ